MVALLNKDEVLFPQKFVTDLRKFAKIDYLQCDFFASDYVDEQSYKPLIDKLNADYANSDSNKQYDKYRDDENVYTIDNYPTKLLRLSHYLYIRSFYPRSGRLSWLSIDDYYIMKDEIENTKVFNVEYIELKQKLMDFLLSLESFYERNNIDLNKQR